MDLGLLPPWSACGRSMSAPVVIHTAAATNNFTGGWGAVIEQEGAQRKSWGGEEGASGQRMEILAAVKALGALPSPSVVKLHCWSSHGLLGMTEWIQGWRGRNWKSSNGKAVKDADLWKQLDQLAAVHQVEWLGRSADAPQGLAERGMKEATNGAFGASSPE